MERANTSPLGWLLVQVIIGRSKLSVCSGIVPLLSTLYEPDTDTLRNHYEGPVCLLSLLAWRLFRVRGFILCPVLELTFLVGPVFDWTESKSLYIK